VQVLLGLGMILVFSVIAEKFQLRVIAWLLTNVASYWIIAFVILFQNEIRKALARLGNNEMLKYIFHSEISESSKDYIIKVVFTLSKLKTGALIAIENSISLNDVIKTGVEINADISTELLLTIFFKNTALHDGAVIITNNKIAAAAAILPLSNNYSIQKTYGTRHRAALGLSEETDALVIVVSEETGKITVAYKGKYYPINSEDELREIMILYLK